MCGIVGYIGNKKATPVLIDGLLCLEYRGYDSAGIATIEKDSIKVMKDKGRVKNLYNLEGINELKGTIEVIEKLQKENLIFLKSRIKYIIENKITDIKEIEIILDQLLI